jgi:hypothetical protein
MATRDATAALCWEEEAVTIHNLVKSAWAEMRPLYKTDVEAVAGVARVTGASSALVAEILGRCEGGRRRGIQYHERVKQRPCGPNKAPRKTCSRGHSLEGGNLYVSPKGHKRCRTCHRERVRERRDRKPRLERYAESRERYRRKMLKQGRLVHPKGSPACRRGHAYTDENTILRPSGGRECRACRRLNQNARRARGRRARLGSRRSA